MIKFKKSEKKPVIEQIKKEEISRGRLQVKSEMPDLEKNLSEVVPQARLIKDPDPNNFMNFQVEYTPEKDSLWFGGKYVFSFAFHDDFPMIYVTKYQSNNPLLFLHHIRFLLKHLLYLL